MIPDHLAHATLVGNRPRTVRSRKEVLINFSHEIAPRPLNKATRRDVERFLTRPLSAASRRVYLFHLRAFYQWAVEEGLCVEDPTAKIGTIRVKPGMPRPITQDELALALVSAPPRMRAWILLMSLAGLRCLEVAALRPRDLIVGEQGTLLFLRECKGGGTATVPAHPAILEALACLPVRNGAWWTVQSNTVSTDTSRFLHDLGIDATAHRLRHTFGTSSYRASGHDLLTTAQLLRHAKVSTTQVYAKVDPLRPAQVVGLLQVPSMEPVQLQT